MTRYMQDSLEKLGGRPGSKEELEFLGIWARTRIHWSAEILQVVARPKGYLLEVIANPFMHSQWFGIDFAEIDQRLHAVASDT